MLVGERLGCFWCGCGLGIPKNSFLGENPTDAASWFSNVPLVARDHMHVDVTHGLAGSKTFIDANIKADRIEFVLEFASHPNHERRHVFSFLIGEIKIRLHMATWNDQGMPWRYRKHIFECDRQRTVVKNARFGEIAISACVWFVHEKLCLNFPSLPTSLMIQALS